jgi:chorismate dehydratase
MAFCIDRESKGCILESIGRYPFRMQPIRIACVRYLNTAPLIEGLDKLAACELVPTVPSRIAGMIERGDVDLGLASVFDAARSGLALIPSGMIGSDGPTLTVRLFSKVPLNEIRQLHADTDSHTSVVLCQLLLRRLHRAAPEITAWDAQQPSGSLPDAVLLIGDKVVTNAPPAATYPHQLDLGEAWKALTGLPFVYAVWMCRTDRANDPRVRIAAALVDRQRRHNRTRLDWIVSSSAAEHGWPVDLAAQYLGSLLRYEVGERERAAIEMFLAMAREDALLAGPVDPPWIGPIATTAA